MSSVLARKRGVSSMEFYRTADELRNALMKALMNDNIVPKRWKPIFTFPVAEMLDDLFGHIFAAYNIYADTVEKVAEKRRYQTYALTDLDRIDDKLQQLLTQLYYGKIDADHPMPFALEQAGTLIDRDYELIAAWRTSTKLIKGKSRN